MTVDLNYMSPSILPAYPRDNRRIYIETFCDSILMNSLFVKVSDYFNFSFIQFRVRKIFSTGLAIFSYLVSVIVGLRTQPKMLWINTRWVITSRTIMKNIHSFWNFASMNSIGNSMNSFGFIIARAHLTMARRLAISDPPPASWRLFYFSEKSFLDRYGFEFILASSTSFFRWVGQANWTAAIITLFGRMYSHWKIIPFSAVPPSVQSLRRLFSGSIIAWDF